MLSERLRAGIEAAPWVVNAVRELEEKQRWISVKESLPEPESGDGWGRKVLALYDSGSICVESMFLYQASRPSVQSTRYFMGERQTGVTAKVTHWMELPPLPTEV